MCRNGSSSVRSAMGMVLLLAAAMAGCVGGAPTEESGEGLRGRPRNQFCGAWLGDTCLRGEYCAYAAEAMCGAFDEPGLCTPRPNACIQLVDPVCGCDGQTYGNACTAASAGTSVAYAGECAPDPEPEPIFCGGIAGFPCPDGMTCQLDGDYPDAGGHCVADEGVECGDTRCPAGYSCVECFGDPQCLPPDTYCAF